jgi:hypothetical protein
MELDEKEDMEVVNFTDSTVNRSQAMIEALGDHELSPGVPLGSGTALRRHDAPDARRRDVDPDLVQLTLDPPVAPHRVLPRHPPDEELGLKGDCLSLVDPMRPAPLTADELAVPASERVGRKQVGEALAQRSEPLDNREDKPLLPRRLRVGHLATQNGELLAQDKQLEILRARRPARKQQEPENLAKGERDKANSHRPSLAAGGVSVLGLALAENRQLFEVAQLLAER